MKSATRLIPLIALAFAAASTFVQAQPPGGNASGEFRGPFGGPLPETFPPPQEFASSTEHYEYLPENAETDARRNIAVNVTFYDEISLFKPVAVTYAYRHRADLEAGGYRICHWECESNDNTYLTFDENGVPSTQYRLPGEEEFIDPRGADRVRNPDLPPA